MRILYLFVLIFTLFACKESEPVSSDIIASVYSEHLTETELQYWMGEEDTPSKRTQYIDMWIRKQLLLREAKPSPKQRKAIEQLSEDYKETLIINRHKKAYLEKHLNRTIDEKDLMEQYEQLKQSYKLKQAIFKIEIYSVPSDMEKLIDLKSFFKLDKFDSFYEVLSEAHVHSSQDSSVWVSSSKLSQQLPKEILGSSAIKTKKKLMHEQNDQVFFIRVYDYIDKNRIAPLSYMKTNLKHAILEKRKLELLDKYSQSLYASAMKNKQIKQN